MGKRCFAQKEINAVLLGHPHCNAFSTTSSALSQTVGGMAVSLACELVTELVVAVVVV